jgi:hypothetical protein
MYCAGLRSKHIADVEIRLALTFRRLELRILFMNAGSIHRDGRVMSENEVLQFGGGTLQWGQPEAVLE